MSLLRAHFFLLISSQVSQSWLHLPSSGAFGSSLLEPFLLTFLALFRPLFGLFRSVVVGVEVPVVEAAVAALAAGGVFVGGDPAPLLLLLLLRLVVVVLRRSAAPAAPAAARGLGQVDADRLDAARILEKGDGGGKLDQWDGTIYRVFLLICLRIFIPFQ